jgi:hypothetical protein
VGIVAYGYLAVGLIIALESLGFRYPARTRWCWCSPHFMRLAMAID